MPSQRTLSTWSPHLDMQTRADGSIIVQRTDALGPYPRHLLKRFVQWADKTPEQTWIAQRDKHGQWCKLTYSDALPKIRAVAQALMNLKLSVERPLAILSGNSIDHAIMAMGAQLVGIPSASISTAYSLIASDFTKLKDISSQLTPGLIYAEDGEQFSAAIAAAFDHTVPTVCSHNPKNSRDLIDFQTMCTTTVTAEVDEAFNNVGPDTIAKFLFTSGTTGSPKAVIQTQRMLCSNVEMATDCYAFMRTTKPVVIDWCPWSHVAAGNFNFNIVIYNGGTYYIDSGKPSPTAFASTIENLRDVSPTWYFNVPVGYEMLVSAMEKDDLLRDNFFRDLHFMNYAAAAMAQHTWDRLNALSVASTGKLVLLSTGLGATETAPFAMMCTEAQDVPGNVGVPAQGVQLKLVPVEGKLEVRMKGPSITPGYWRNKVMTEAAFDEEGFYKLGDALRFASPGDPSKGFFFDGRIAENFKLNTGTWVAVGPLRAKLIDQLQGCIKDAVIVGENRDKLGAILLPALEKLASLVEDGEHLSEEQLISHPRVREHLSSLLNAHIEHSTGSSNRVTRMVFLNGPPSFDAGEITDKGSINQRAVIRHRTELVESLYTPGNSNIIYPLPEPTADAT